MKKDDPTMIARLKDSWDKFCLSHPAIARLSIAALVCLLLWLILWFLLFSNMSGSADLIYAKF